MRVTAQALITVGLTGIAMPVKPTVIKACEAPRMCERSAAYGLLTQSKNIVFVHWK